MTMTDVPDTANGSTADALRREFIDDDLLDRLVESSSKRGIGLTGEDGFLPELIKAVLERGMQAELTDHLGYEKHDRPDTVAGIRVTERHLKHFKPR